MWFSNVQALNNQYPEALTEHLPAPTTLQQGIKSVGPGSIFARATRGWKPYALFYFVQLILRHCWRDSSGSVPPSRRSEGRSHARLCSRLCAELSAVVLHRSRPKLLITCMLVMIGGIMGDGRAPRKNYLCRNATAGRAGSSSIAPTTGAATRLRSWLINGPMTYGFPISKRGSFATSAASVGPTRGRISVGRVRRRRWDFASAPDRNGYHPA